MKPRNYIIKIAITSVLIMGFTVSLFSEPVSMKSRKDYIYTMKLIRNMGVMVRNFPENGISEDFTLIKSAFADATVDFYGQRYIESHKKYRALKLKLVRLLNKISQNYLKRSKELLDSTSKEAFEIIIKYSKHSPIIKSLQKPWDVHGPDKRPYDASKFHLFYDKVKIEAYLKAGYKKYTAAEKLPLDGNIDVLKNKRNLPSEKINYIIDNYYKTIEMCREAKHLGIEIYKIIHLNKMLILEIKQGISSRNRLPIFDPRIPEKYKVDANDNENRIHLKEKEKLKSSS